MRRNAWVLYLAVLLTGSCGLAYEYTVSKVASDLLGNSTRQWAMIIGVMMFFMGLGANYQKKLAQKMLFTYFAVSELLLSLLGGGAPLLLLWAYAYWQSYYVLWQYLLIAAIGFLIGLEIPVIARINGNFTPELKVNIGRILQLDYVGALGGAVLWSYWLIPYLPLSRAAAVLGFSNLGACWLFMLHFYRQLRWRKVLLLSGAVVTLSMSWAFIQGPQWSLRSEQGLYRDQIILSKTTAYQHLVLTQSARERENLGRREREYRLYINGHLQFSSLDEYIYHENLVHPAFAVFRRHNGRDPRRVLILGGGDGLALREVRKYAAVAEAILCDLDPEMLALAAQNPIMRRLNRDALNARGVQGLAADRAAVGTEVWQRDSVPYLAGSGASFPQNISNAGKPLGETLLETGVLIKDMDAARYINEAYGLFDIIIADFPDPNSEALSKLYSLSFYHSVLRKLSAGGVFVQQSTSPVYAYKAFWAIGRTMMAAGLEALPYHDLVPSFGEWGWWLAQAYSPPAAGELPMAPMGSTGPRLQQLYAQSRLSGRIQLRYLSDSIMQANVVFPRQFEAMYRESLPLLSYEFLSPNKVGQQDFRVVKSQLEQDYGRFYRDWVTTLTQHKVYEYYLGSAWK